MREIARTSITLERNTLNAVKKQAIDENKTQTELIVEYIERGLKESKYQSKLDVE